MKYTSTIKIFIFSALFSFMLLLIFTIKTDQIKIAEAALDDTGMCVLPNLSSEDVQENWRWAPEDGEYTDVMSTPAIADLDPTDDNNTPQVIVNAFDYDKPCTWQCDGRVRVLDGAEGKEVNTFNKYDISDARLKTHPRSQMAVGNIDADQELEIVIHGSNYCSTTDGSTPTQICGGSAPACGAGTQCMTGGVFALNHDGSVLWWMPNQSGMYELLSIYDYDQDGRPEVQSGSFILDGATGEKIGSVPSPSSSYLLYHNVADIDNDEKNELIAGGTIFEVNGRDNTSFFTEKYRVNGWESASAGISDFNNDGNPDLLLVKNTTTEIGVFDLQSGSPQPLWSKTYDIGYCVNGSTVKSESICDVDSDCTAYGSGFKCDAQNSGKPGAPVIADFDGDNIPDIGVKGKNVYVAINGNNGDLLWDYRRDRDDSEYTDISASSSSAFDFNNDGAFEITQRNSKYFYIFDGKGENQKGKVLFKSNVPSSTLWELAPIADVNNDKHADIIVPTNGNSSGTYKNTGIIVYKSATNSWPGTRTIWNQDNYYIDNICDGTEGIGGCNYGDIPSQALRPWERTNSLRANTVNQCEASISTSSTTGRTHIFPANTQILLNNEEICTSTKEISVQVRAQNASEVLVSNDSNFVGANWENFSGELTKTWTLSAGDDTKTVYAMFRSLTGDTSSIITKNINLDETGKCGQETKETVTEITPPASPIILPTEEIEVLGEETEVPEEKVCAVECKEMSYILYIINPDGSQRFMNTEYTRTEILPDGRKRVKFEDSGLIDQDFNDLWVIIDDRDCSNFIFTLEQVSAGWKHRVGVYILENNAKKMDVQLWADSHNEEGATKQINGQQSKEFCSTLSGGNPLAIPSVTLYDDVDYKGKFVSFNTDRENLNLSEQSFNDKTKSIKLPAGVKALLFEDTLYQNTFVEIENSIPNLDLTTIKNNTLSSLKIMNAN